MSLAVRCLCLLSCLFPGPQEAPSSASSSAPSRSRSNGESWTLFQGLHASGRIEILVPPGPTERAAQRLQVAIVQSGFQASTNPEPSDPGAVRVLCGGPGDVRLAALLEPCGVQVLTDGFRFAGRQYRSSGDALRAVFEDPEHPGRPLCLFLGNDLETLGAYLTEIPRLSLPGLFVWADGDPAVRCSLSPQGAPLDDLEDYLAVREQLFAGVEREMLRGVDLLARDLPGERRAAYARKLFTAWNRVEGWLGPSPPAKAPAVPPDVAAPVPEEEQPPEAPSEPSEPGPRVELFVYSHLEDLRAALGTSALSVVNRLHPRVHVLLAPGLPDDDGRGVAYALARALAGEPARPWLGEAVAVAAAGHWWGVPLADWIGRLAYSMPFPPLLAVVSDRSSEQLAPHVLGPVRGLVFTILSRSGGPRLLRGLWNGGRMPKSAPGALRSAAQQALRVFLDGRPGDSTKPGVPKSILEAPVRHGLALCAPRASDLGRRGVARALDEAGALWPGPDAVSITVFATEREPAPPQARLEGGCVFGSPSDVELASAVAAARQRALRVLLTLEPLAGPSGSWADVRAYNGFEAQPGFWARYDVLVGHYALLSQLLGVEILALGADLREASRTATDGAVQDERLFAARRAGWKRVIARARRAFDGGLTYVARFPREAGEIDFWDQLDFLSIAFFPQLARRGGEPDADQVRRLVRLGLRDALDLAVVWNKPLLVAQTGFPARAASWSWPAAPAGAPDEKPLRAYLEALAEALEGPLEDRDQLRGLFLWSWPVEEAPVEGAAAARDFFLRGRGLDDVLARLLTR